MSKLNSLKVPIGVVMVDMQVDGQVVVEGQEEEEGEEVIMMDGQEAEEGEEVIMMDGQEAEEGEEDLVVLIAVYCQVTLVVVVINKRILCRVPVELYQKMKIFSTGLISCFLRGIIAQSVTVSTLAGYSGAYTFANGQGTFASFYGPLGLSADSNGNLFVADSGNNRIRKITSSGLVSTFAGSGVGGSSDGQGVLATFSSPSAIAIDLNGNLFVADSNNHKIRKITSSAVVSTFGGSGDAGSTDGQGTAASFNSPSGVAVDASGNVYVADTENNVIRRISPSGVVSTFAGSGTNGFVDGQDVSASFARPYSVAVDFNGTIYVADTGNNRIRTISPSGYVSTFAGSGFIGSDDSQGVFATFSSPKDLTVDLNRNVYVADLGNNRIRVISPSGLVSTFAGSGSIGCIDDQGYSASFARPGGITVDAFGTVFVSDTGNQKIRSISSSGLVTTLAGSGPSTFADGLGSSASFFYPSGLAVDLNGNLYVADTVNQRVRKVLASGLVSTIAGSGYNLFANDEGIYASFSFPRALAVDWTGNVFVADTENNMIRLISSTGNVTTFAGSGAYGSTDGEGLDATFGRPTGLAIDWNGNLFVSDTDNSKIRKITPTGLVTTFAVFSAPNYLGSDQPFRDFAYPRALAIDLRGNLYVADPNNHKILKITSSGVISTLAGSGVDGFANGQGTNAAFNSPSGIAVDSSGNVYVADTMNDRIRKITPSGLVTTLAGTGDSGFSDGPGANATFFGPTGLAIHSSSRNLYVSDQLGNRVRKITNVTTSITVSIYTTTSVPASQECNRPSIYLIFTTLFTYILF